MNLASDCAKPYANTDILRVDIDNNIIQPNKYICNNKKFEDIIKSQQKTKLMYKDLQKLKDIVLDYQRRTNSLLAFGNQSYLSDNNTTPLLNKSQ
jgi:hypothetical protein